MSEFWALVLGAALATLGGILGTLFSEALKNREKKQDSKREAYIKLINLCNVILISNVVDLEKYYNEICEGMTLAHLYASPEVKSSYNDIVNYVIENKHTEMVGNKTVKALLTVMVAHMKQELKIADSDSKELLKKIKDNKPVGG